MIKQTAVITRTDNGLAHVKVVRESTCGQCGVQKGCGTSVFSKVLGNKFSEVIALNPINAEADDIVILGMRESTLISSALLMYLFPLLAMFLAGIVVAAMNAWFELGLGQGWIIAASFTGLILAFLTINKVSNTYKDDKRFQPVILSKASYSEINASGLSVNN